MIDPGKQREQPNEMPERIGHALDVFSWRYASSA
jgi:hypothetical protein